MVTMATSVDTLSEIRSGPHWEVVIHPAKFEDARIPSLRECLEAVEQSTVALRGWPYPYVNPETMEWGEDWIASSVDFSWGPVLHREHWRLYQSGQFVHRFAFWEDNDPGYDHPHGGSGTLHAMGALYTFTEIFEFAARLMAAGALDAAPVVKVAMQHIEGRSVVRGVPGILPSECRATADTLEHEWQLTGPGIYGEAAQRAREATLWFFERFGRDDFSEESLKREQDEFRAKRGLPLR